MVEGRPPANFCGFGVRKILRALVRFGVRVQFHRVELQLRHPNLWFALGW